MKLLVAGTAISGPQRSGMTRSLFSCARVELTLFTSDARPMRLPDAMTSFITSMRSFVSPLWLMATKRSPSRSERAYWPRNSPGRMGITSTRASSLKKSDAARAACCELPQQTT